MANYGLVVNSTFQPFTYQELAAPLDRQELYHEKLAEEYDKMSAQADVLEAMGANDRDKGSGAYSRYKAYSDSLRKEADDLYRFGLNTESRQRLSNLRRRYNTDIVPIQNAWNKREQESAEQMKASLQNPSLMFTRNAANTSLDDYIRNPQGGYGVINGANITAQMSAMAKNLEKQIRQGDSTLENIDPYTYNYIKRWGLDANTIKDWRNSPILTKMFEQVMASNGVTPEALSQSANMQDIIDKSTGYAEMGMWNAIGKEEATQIENYGARLEAQAQKEIAVARAKAADKDNTGDDNVPTVTSVGVGMQSTEEYSAKNLEALNSLKTGHDGLKSAYFGKNMGQVNPMQIYDEYQQERKKHTKKVNKRQEVNNPYAPTPQYINVKVDVPDDEAAKKAVLAKYAKYGVTNILSDDQYKAMSDMGYSAKNNIKSNRHSALLQDFNKTVEQRSRYSTNMADYESFNEKAIPNLRSREQYGKEIGTVWAITNDGKLGKPEKIKDLNLHSAENTKGNKVTDVQYDPQFKGKIVIQLSDGSLHVADPGIYDSNLSNMIQYAERQGAPAMAITMAITRHLNERNKVKGKTDSKIE